MADENTLRTLEEKLGQPVYDTHDVVRIVKDLGAKKNLQGKKLTHDNVLVDIRGQSIDYASLEVVLSDHGYVFTEQVVWDYILSLEQQQRLDLEGLGLGELKELKYFSRPQYGHVKPGVYFTPEREREDRDDMDSHATRLVNPRND